MSDINEMNVGLRWYVAHTYSGYENKVKQNLEQIVKNRGMEDVRNITGVTGFVGPGSKPVPLTEEEVAAFLPEEGRVTTSVGIAVGDNVDIVDGMFRGYSGRVTAISDDGKEVTVVVPTVGRDMTVTLERKHVKKAAE